MGKLLVSNCGQRMSELLDELISIFDNTNELLLGPSVSDWIRGQGGWVRIVQVLYRHVLAD